MRVTENGEKGYFFMDRRDPRGSRLGYQKRVKLTKRVVKSSYRPTRKGYVNRDREDVQFLSCLWTVELEQTSFTNTFRVKNQ